MDGPETMEHAETNRKDGENADHGGWRVCSSVAPKAIFQGLLAMEILCLFSPCWQETSWNVPCPQELNRKKLSQGNSPPLAGVQER
jgi:hypothetical protein